MRITADAGGPISDTLAWRASVSGQRGRTFYRQVRNEFNSFYGALAWRPSSKVTVDWSGSYDNYYNFTISRGWNRPTQALVDSFGGQYYAGRATPLIRLANGQIISPVFTSSNPTAAPIGYQVRTANAQNQYIAGATVLGALPNGTAANPGTIVGWVYDPTIPGNGLTRIDPSVGSGRPQDKNQAVRVISQLQVGVEFNPVWSLAGSFYFQRSINKNDSVGSFIYQNRSNLYDGRIELRGKDKAEVLGLPVEWQGNFGVSARYLGYKALSANNNFNYNPYDLTLDPSTITPSALLGLPQADPASSGSWIGQPGVPQLSPYFGYLRLPTMVAVNDGFYSEIGGFPSSGGAVYTSQGNLRQWSFFAQQNLKLAEVVGINLGFNYSWIRANIENPVYINASQIRSDSGDYGLPSWQGSFYVKPTKNTTIYFTYDHSKAVNTGVFGAFLTWGPGNKLNPLAFDSSSVLYEAGFKWDAIPGKLFFSSDVFKQLRDTSPDTNGNMAKQQIKGIEASIRYQPTAQFSLGANYTHLDALYTYVVPAGFSPFGFYADNATVFGDSNALNRRTGGRYGVPGVPRHSFSGFVDYHLKSGLGAELAAWYTTSWFTNLSQSVTIPPGYQANLSLYLRKPRYDVTLRILNVTNQKNFQNALTNGEFLLPLPTRSLQLQFGLHF